MPDKYVCRRCNGTGKIVRVKGGVVDGFKEVPDICPDCNGTGRIDTKPIHSEVGTAKVFSTTGELLASYTGITDCIIRSVSPTVTVLTTNLGDKIVINGGIVIYTANTVDSVEVK